MTRGVQSWRPGASDRKAALAKPRQGGSRRPLYFMQLRRGELPLLYRTPVEGVDISGVTLKDPGPLHLH